jgi:phosphatidylinositol kinase/protein kinase (PI-3  family)
VILNNPRQLVSWFERVWAEAGVDVLVRSYGVLPTEPGAGIIEVSFESPLYYF